MPLREWKVKQAPVYRLSFFEKQDEKYRSIKTEFIAEWQTSIVNTYENIKAELIPWKTDLPNPADYGIETPLAIPSAQCPMPNASNSLCSHQSFPTPALQRLGR